MNGWKPSGAKELEATEKLLSLDQKLSVAQTAHSQFEQAYQLVAAINGPLARDEASPGCRPRLIARWR